MLNKLKNFYISERLCKVDEDFLSYEEDFISKEDLDTIISLLQDEKKLKAALAKLNVAVYKQQSGLEVLVDQDELERQTRAATER